MVRYREEYREGEREERSSKGKMEVRIGNRGIFMEFLREEIRGERRVEGRGEEEKERHWSSWERKERRREGGVERRGLRGIEI